MSTQLHQKPSQCYRFLHMIEKRRHGTGKSVLLNMSSTILSWEALWNMDTKALYMIKSLIHVEWHQV